MMRRKGFAIFMGFLFGIIGIPLFYFTHSLPPLKDINSWRPPVITKVISDDGKVVGELFLQRRILVPNEKIPRLLKQAFVAAEDADFYRHKGISLVGIARAMLKNVEAGRVVQGGSTITQQLVRSLILDPERTLSRKIKEMILAWRIEQQLTKDEILFLYLNQIYLGHGNYGIGAAADYYFGKSPDNLNLAEIALLAGLPRAPELYSPYRNFELAKRRQLYVLNRMVEEGYISEHEARIAYATPLKLKEHDRELQEASAYYVDYVRQYLLNRYGEKTVYEEGLTVYVAMDSRLQKAAFNSVREGILNISKRQGYKGPERILKEKEIKDFCKALQQENKRIEVGKVYLGVVLNAEKDKVWVSMGKEKGYLESKNLNWLKGGLKRGYVIRVKVKERVEDTFRLELYQEPEVEGAFLAMELPTGYVRAMVGGYDFHRSQFNRALQAKRQPGSAFKPLVYAAALTKGFTPVSKVLDVPVVYPEENWRPMNYQGRFYGPVTLRFALAQSLNCATVNLARELGIDYIIQFAKRLGINSPLSRDLSTVLGSSPVTLLELLRAFAVFATGGHLIQPIFVKKVVDREGKVLEENEPLPLEGELRKQGIEPQGRYNPQVLDEGVAYLMTNMLQSVVKEGTAQMAKSLGWPCAGKTGTTDDYTDAWFIGYVPHLIAGVWVGFDKPRSLGPGETGARAALPIWVNFMKEALSGLVPHDFPLPEGEVVFIRVNPETGLPASPEEEGVFEPFLQRVGPSPQATPSLPDASPQPQE
jgi:penicillin-binding protein 1A